MAVAAAVAAHRLSQSSGGQVLEVLNLPGEGEVFCLLVDRRSQLLQRRYLSSTGDRTTATTTPPTAAAATTMARLSLPLFFSSPPLVVVARSFQVFFAAVGDIEAARSLESRGRRRHSQCGPVEHRESEREREQRPLSVPTSARRPSSKAFLPPPQWRPPIHALTLVTTAGT